MSYTRHFSKTITVHYSGSVSYPASQSGGTKSYSGSTKETIHFNVTVDTDPFDESVEHMKDGVDLLTGSVAATEAAQVSSIRENSARIGQTIISGFFKTVKSDISQQITELRTRTDALLVQLNELAKRCNVKRVMAEAVKWGARGARINSISPGIIVTPLALDEFDGPRGDFYKKMFARCPAGRPGTADEVARVAELLMGPQGSFITGADFLIDGGATAAYFYGPLRPQA